MRRDRKRVTLEPELEKIAGEWSPLKRIEVGMVYLRWGRELVVSGRVLLHARPPERRPRCLRPLPRRRLAQN